MRRHLPSVDIVAISTMAKKRNELIAGTYTPLTWWVPFSAESCPKMNCEKCSNPNPPEACFCNICGVGLARPAVPAVRLNLPKVVTPAHVPSGSADGKIAAIVIWAVCAVGLLIVFTTWANYSAPCAAGATCGPFWTKLMFVGSVLGFGLGGRLWAKR